MGAEAFAKGFIRGLYIAGLAAGAWGGVLVLSAIITAVRLFCSKTDHKEDE